MAHAKRKTGPAKASPPPSMNVSLSQRLRLVSGAQVELLDILLALSDRTGKPITGLNGVVPKLLMDRALQVAVALWDVAATQNDRTHTVHGFMQRLPYARIPDGQERPS